MKSWILTLGITVLLFHCEKDERVTRLRTYLMYSDYGIVFTFDMNDSLDGFIMANCPNERKALKTEYIDKQVLIPCVGVFGVRFNDSEARVIDLLGAPTSIREPIFPEQPKDLTLKMITWQNADTTLIISLANDSVTKITNYLRPTSLPFGLYWRAHKDSVKKIMGPPQVQGNFKTTMPIEF